MAVKILMPKLSDTMEEGVIAAWHKEVGDAVSSGDLLAEIETDKATMEYEAFEEGTLLYIVDEQSTVAVDDLIAIVGDEGEEYEDLLSGGGAEKKEAKSEGKEESKSEKQTDTQTKEKEEKKSKSSEKIDVSSINAKIVQMPKLSDTMEEGVIAEWHKSVGDKVESGDLLAEIETDKATMEYEAFEEGTLLHIAAEKGDSVPVDDLLCVIGEEGADYEALVKHFKQGGGDGEEEAEEKEKSSSSEKAKSASNGQTEAKTSSSTSNGRIKVSPLAKKMAEDKGYDLSEISGSGDGGRIVKRDIEEFTPSAKKETKKEDAPTSKQAGKETSGGMPGVGQESFEETPVSQMRKTIARRLSESKFQAPHFYLTMEIPMDGAMETRKKLNEMSPVKISFNDMVIKAAAVSLRQHPGVNSAWMGDKIRKNDHVHVGMAVAVPEGLLVPVIRFADLKSLSQIASETKDLAQKAKDKKLQPADWEGNTFSVSNLGMFGIEEFTAIINPPDSCIMAVGTIKQTGVVKEGILVPGNVMKVTLSCDHRVVDGAMGAAFLQTFKGLMEEPIRMLV